MNAAELVQAAVGEICSCPPDLRGNDGVGGEIQYIETTLPSYERTIADILGLFPEREDLSGLNFLELGAFLGVVSKALSLASASVVACDIPEFFARPNVKSYYGRLGVPIRAFNLRDYAIPLPSDSQDCVLACETFEHLNFNPLPVFAEINRVLKLGGHLYVSMPNGGYFLKRVRYLLSGETPGFTVRELFAQLDEDDNMVVGLHWKEYSLAQTMAMVIPLGFEVVSARTLNDTASAGRSLARRLFKALIPGGDTQVVVFRKVSAFEGKLSVCPDS